MKKIEIEVYTIQEIKEINKKAYNDIIEQEKNELYLLYRDIYWADYNQDLTIINEILKKHNLKIEWYTHYYTNIAKIKAIDYQENIINNRAYGKLHFIIKDLKEYKCYNWCIDSIINYLEENKKNLLNSNISLWEILTDALNNIVNDIENIEILENDVIEDLNNNHCYFLKNGKPFNI